MRFARDGASVFVKKLSHMGQKYLSTIIPSTAVQWVTLTVNLTIIRDTGGYNKNNTPVSSHQVAYSDHLNGKKWFRAVRPFAFAFLMTAPAASRQPPAACRQPPAKRPPLPPHGREGAEASPEADVFTPFGVITLRNHVLCSAVIVVLTYSTNNICSVCPPLRKLSIVSKIANTGFYSR